MSRSQAEPQEPRSRAKWWIGGLIVMVAVGAAAYFFWPSKGEQPVQVATAPPKPTTQPAILIAAVHQAIDESSSADIVFNCGKLACSGKPPETPSTVQIDDGTKFNLPAGSRVVTVQLEVDNRKIGLLDEAEPVGAKIFQQAFQVGPDIAEVHIDFIGPVFDRYGHPYKMPWITFVMSRATYAKIIWSNFNADTLCDFLNHENEFDTHSGTFCGSLGDL